MISFLKKQNSAKVMQHCAVIVIEKWEQIFRQITDLLEASDYLLHGFLIAKLVAHHLKDKSVQLIQSYHFNKQQRVRVNRTYSTFFDIIFEA